MCPRRYVVTPILAHISESINVGGQPDSPSLRVGTLAEGRTGVVTSVDHSKEHVIGIVGKRGSGKSYSLGKMIEALSDKSGIFNVVPTTCVSLLHGRPTVPAYVATVPQLSWRHPFLVQGDYGQRYILS